MSAPRSPFLQVLTERGFIHQCSDPAGLDEVARIKARHGLYRLRLHGVLAPCRLLVPIMMLRWLQATGHKPIVLMGGGTTRVGDPSGRDEGRRILSLEDIEANKAGIASVFARFLSFGEGEADAVMIDNAEWLTKLNYIEFLRDVGRHFSINRMLSFDSVRLRSTGAELSFIEFNYMILRPTTSWSFTAGTGACLQMGGSDQWGNIVNGIDLGRRMGTEQLYALTSPLITLASGAKMGKTAAGAVWLNADLLSPYDYWQFWRNTEDADVGRFLKLFTVLPMDEIARLEALDGVEVNDAKKVLATEATALLHGREVADEAAGTARKTFEEGALADTLPTVEVPRFLLEGGLGVLAAFGPDYARLLPSTSEARRQVRSGGLKVNDRTVTDERATLGPGDLSAEGVIKLSFGRKRHVLLRAA
jgi:tyrosyl-tRNA synthetase